MTHSPKDGGQAFPMPQAETSQGGHWEENGMSLRDWFAGQALAALIAHYEEQDGGMDDIPASAFQYADAMLIARATGEKEAKE